MSHTLLNKYRFKHCPCCQHKKFKPFYLSRNSKEVINSKDFMFGGWKYISDIFSCRKCNFKFINNIIRGENFYSSSTIIENDNLIDLSRINYFKKIRDKLFDTYAIRNNATVFDLACGSGEWLDCLPKSFVKSGFEINKDLISKLKRKNVKIYRLEEIKDESLDLISAFDYLEHVIAPDKLIKLMLQKLKPEGVIVIGVPDMGKFISVLLRQRYYIYTPMHYSYFEKKSIKMLFCNHLKNVDFLKCPPMYPSFHSIIRWIFNPKNLSSYPNFKIPLGYKASLIILGKKN